MGTIIWWGSPKFFEVREGSTEYNWLGETIALEDAFAGQEHSMLTEHLSLPLEIHSRPS